MSKRKPVSCPKDEKPLEEQAGGIHMGGNVWMLEFKCPVCKFRLTHIGRPPTNGRDLYK